MNNQEYHCPHCGNEESYYVKQEARGPIYYLINFDGSEADNTEMYEGLRYTTGKYGYCSGCNKRLFKVDRSMRPLEVTHE